MIKINPHTLIVTLNNHGLNSPIKRHRLTELNQETEFIYLFSKRNTPKF